MSNSNGAEDNGSAFQYVKSGQLNGGLNRDRERHTRGRKRAASATNDGGSTSRLGFQANRWMAAASLRKYDPLLQILQDRDRTRGTGDPAGPLNELAGILQGLLGLLYPAAAFHKIGGDEHQFGKGVFSGRGSRFGFGGFLSHGGGLTVGESGWVS